MRIFQTKKDILKGKIIEKKWKQSNQKYILALEMFLDRASNIQDEALKNSIINSMLACDKILTDMAEEYFIEIYKVAYKEGKRYKIKKRGYKKDEKRINRCSCGSCSRWDWSWRISDIPETGRAESI